jgi:uncharacterized protein YjbI with pentapeptide repeats
MGCDLSEANFQHAKLACCNLSQATLGRSNVSGAHFRECVLVELDARHASFAGSHFEHCNLSHSNTSHGDWRGAHLYRANLHGMIQVDTVWDNVSNVLPIQTDAQLLRAETWVSPV